MNTNNLANFIITRRLELKKTQKELAKSAQISQSVLSRIESGNIKRPTAETLDKLAEGLTTPLSVFYSFIDSETREIEHFNIYPLIQSLANSTCTILTLLDLQFLLGIQKELGQTMTTVLIDELMKARKTKVETPND